MSTAPITRRGAAGIAAAATGLVVAALPVATLASAHVEPAPPDVPAHIDRTDNRTDGDGDYSTGGSHVERGCFMVRSSWGEGGEHVPRCYTYIRNRPAELR
ncbi:hypothetical protein GHK92_13175 [Nocardioides sp. dk4132]|uniref:hypothetical protein n=1 Tax=unclassified Nocardioides TaxID=2615069 RepID=UPI001296CC37|nr:MULTISPECIES: hypothetical protein [unclassified Nocardioides]MQW76828.1 hypothetical protein [Nocardioides sp. dk4132]QGA06822.1 hypothetical protein GFH29_05045 [Nocardioides sp. dk884]